VGTGGAAAGGNAAGNSGSESTFGAFLNAGGGAGGQIGSVVSGAALRRGGVVGGTATVTTGTDIGSFAAPASPENIGSNNGLAAAHWVMHTDKNITPFGQTSSQALAGAGPVLSAAPPANSGLGSMSHMSINSAVALGPSRAGASGRVRITEYF
jgi:hypothetical protein